MHLSADDLINALRERSLRITRARSAICEVLATSPEEHLSAADILDRAREKAGVKINPSTVYRTLDVLEEFGHLHHVHLGHGAGVYHLSKESDHQHLVCERCGTSVEIPLEELAPALSKVTARYGFVAEGVHFALVGTCRSCAEDLNKA
jgi:Fur family ferric uptake transcriptional regulator